MTVPEKIELTGTDPAMNHGQLSNDHKYQPMKVSSVTSVQSNTFVCRMKGRHAISL